MSTDSQGSFVPDRMETDRPETRRTDDDRPETGRADDDRPEDDGQDATDPLAGLHGDSNCSAVLERMHEFLDHELDAETSDAIRAHLDACEHCLDDYDVVHALKALVNRCCRSPKAPQQLRMTIMTSITRWRAG